MGDEELLRLVVMAAAVIIIGGIAAGVLYLEKRRRDRFAAAAGELGARFDARPERDILAAARESLKVFTYYRDRSVRNVIEKRYPGGLIRLFEYTYFRPGSSTAGAWTVALITIPGANFPVVFMGDGGGAGQAREAFTKAPLTFASAAFMETHQVHAEDDSAAGLFTDNLQQFFAERPRYSMETAGEHIALYISGSKAAADEMRERLYDASLVLGELRSRIPG